MKIGVVTFPGSNCDRDVMWVLRHHLGVTVEQIWHQEYEHAGVDALILPGGFSYGDYLRSGAIAAHANIMGYVKRLAGQGAPVLGICNGFQILCEAGLLPGVLIKNKNLKFLCQELDIRVETDRTPWSAHLKGRTLRLPIAHGDGNFFADDATLHELDRQQQVVFRYAGENPNGSVGAIAGICNKQGNVVALMPHPERAADRLLGASDGVEIFSALLK